MSQEKPFDFFETYFDYVQHNTESPMIFHRWCAISILSTVLGRNVWFEHGHKRLYPNQFIMLIGPPATRKSTAINVAKGILEKSGYDMFAPSKTSKEKFIADLAKGYGSQAQPDPVKTSTKKGKYADFSILDESPEDLAMAEESREVIICSGEFNSFIGHNNLEFITLLTDLWDCPDKYSVTNRTTSSSHVREPTINLLGGNTPTNFAQAFPPEAIGQGFTSRVILVNADEPRQKIAFPDPADANLQARLSHRLSEMRQKLKGPMKFTDNARALATKLYTVDSHVDDARFVYYEGRRFDHLLKLAVICAASEMSMEISAAHILYANSILSLTELEMPKALGEYGKNKLSDLQHKVFESIRLKPQSILELYRAHMQDCNNPRDVSEVIHNLKTGRKVLEAKEKNAEGHVLFAAVPKLIKDTTFFDKSLLRECQPEEIEKQQESLKLVS